MVDQIESSFNLSTPEEHSMNSQSITILNLTPGTPDSLQIQILQVIGRDITGGKQFQLKLYRKAILIFSGDSISYHSSDLVPGVIVTPTLDQLISPLFLQLFQRRLLGDSRSLLRTSEGQSATTLNQLTQFRTIILVTFQLKN